MNISASSSVETVSKVTMKLFNGKYSRTIINIHKYNNIKPNYLMIDMILKMKSGNSYVSKLQTYFTANGAEGYQNNNIDNIGI